MKKAERFCVPLDGFRRRPMLPGRVQPSTFGTEGLNFCVRDGNRWNPFVIATGNGELFLPTGKRCFLHPLFPGPVRPFIGTFGPFRRPFLPLPGPLGHSRNPDNCTAQIQFLDHVLPIGSRSFLKSSPRPISIIKLHTLPHFHR